MQVYDSYSLMLSRIYSRIFVARLIFSGELRKDGADRRDLYFESLSWSSWVIRLSLAPKWGVLYEIVFWPRIINSCAPSYSTEIVFEIDIAELFPDT